MKKLKTTIAAGLAAVVLAVGCSNKEVKYTSDVVSNVDKVMVEDVDDTTLDYSKKTLEQIKGTLDEIDDSVSSTTNSINDTYKQLEDFLKEGMMERTKKNTYHKRDYRNIERLKKDMGYKK